MNFDFKSLKKAVTDLGTGLRGVRKQLRELREERDQVANAPPSKADLVGLVERWVADQAAAYQRNFEKQTLQPLLRRPGLLLEPDRAMRGLAVSTGAVARDSNMGAAGIDGALAFVLRDTLTKAMTQAIQDADFAPGLAMVDRAKKVAELDAQIAKLEADEAALVEAASAAGVIVD